MADDLRADLDQLFLQARQRPVLHRLGLRDRPQEVAEIVGERVKLKANGVAATPRSYYSSSERRTCRSESAGGTQNLEYGPWVLYSRRRRLDAERLDAFDHLGGDSGVGVFPAGPFECYFFG
jgi:hypothetical protein